MRERLPNRRISETLDFQVGKTLYTATLGYYEDGRVGEVFLDAGKSGTDVNIATKDSAVATSIALQYGAPLEVMRPAFLRMPSGQPEGPLGTLMDLLAEERAAA